MLEKILVPLDGSKKAERVIPYAEAIVTRLGSQIVLVSIVDPIHGDEEHLRRSYLAGVAARMEDQCRTYSDRACNIKTEILPGKPADEIIKLAAESDDSLITITNRGSTDNGTWSLGSIAAKILRATERPVLLIRMGAPEAARYRKNVICRILLPLDGSKVGEAAIPYAAALAKGVESEVVLFQVIEPVRIVPGYFNIIPVVNPVNEDTIKLEATNYLNKTAEIFKSQQIKTSVALAWGSSAAKIIDYAEANNIDMIAMSTHGESGIGRWVFGSVTDKVINTGNTPVLVVRPTKS